MKLYFDEQMQQIKEAKKDLERMFEKASKLLEGMQHLMYFDSCWCLNNLEFSKTKTNATKDQIMSLNEDASAAKKEMMLLRYFQK